MPTPAIHRFERAGKRFAIDPETCFCFECDAISWDVLEHYPHTPVNRIYHLLSGTHDKKELEEVVGELEWLRATKAILPRRGREEAQKKPTAPRGIKRITIALPRGSSPTATASRRWFGRRQAGDGGDDARAIGQDAVNLMLSRSGDLRELEVEFLDEGSVHDPELVADLCAHALKQGTLAGKTVTAVLHVAGIALANPPEALEGHTVGVKLDFKDPSVVLTHVRRVAKAASESLNRLVKAAQPGDEGVSGRIVVRPNHPRFGAVVEALDKAGFHTIELDLDGAYVANPALDPSEMLEGLNQTAVYYAERLLANRYFRLDPIASLFYRIYDGAPMPRTDPAGTNEFAVDAAGGIYPSGRFLGEDAFRLGSLADGTLDENARARFDEVGGATTGVCRTCWARNLCGGGCTAVHQAFTGSFRKPHEPWCQAQRAWMTAAVAAFNLLSSEGVNFTRVYNMLGHTAKPSLFTMVRAAFRMTIGMRPIEEADAEMLVGWENWSEASYFLCTEGGLLLASRYEREMEVLHPQGIHQELLLIRKDGTPIGLVKLRPERLVGAAQAWVYLHNEADYAAEDVRKGFQTLLMEAGKQQGLRRLTVPASAGETALQSFLHAVGFAREGTLREALFLHGSRHDVHLYGINLEKM
jgi:uncharacterized protein